ncbi:hypothetical protein ACW18Z_00350 [Limosilactobacillus fermentum]
MTITKLKTGRYEARVTWYDGSGKRINRKKSFDHKAEAAKWELEMNTLKQQGALSVRSEGFCGVLLVYGTNATRHPSVNSGAR